VEESAKQWVDDYIRYAGLAPQVSREDTQLLAERADQGDAEAYQSLIDANKRLVVSIARKYVFVPPHEDDRETLGIALPPEGDQLDTLIPKGEEGLRIAVDRFGRSWGSFTALATWYINQAITDPPTRPPQGGDPGDVREPRSPAPTSPVRAVSLDLPGSDL
jgi:hypothetical protein